MYRLLIITGKDALRDMFAEMRPALGFKAPHFRRNLEGVKDCLQKHRIDAIALDDFDGAEECKAYLQENDPDVPFFTLCSTWEEQERVLQELGRLLLRLDADDVNGQYDRHSVLMVQRERWIRRLLSGLVPREDVERHLLLYRYDCATNLPCVFARMSIPEDDDFLSERWHYGADRLQTALLNFFGEEHGGVRMHLAVLSPQEVRLLCVPRDLRTPPNEKMVTEYVQETVNQIEHYLGLRMSINQIRTIRGLEDFNETRTAQ